MVLKGKWLDNGLRTRPSLNDKLFLQRDCGWLKSVSESRSRALLGSCPQGLCGHDVLFYSEGLWCLSIAEFLVHHVSLTFYIHLHLEQRKNIELWLQLYVFDFYP